MTHADDAAVGGGNQGPAAARTVSVSLTIGQWLIRLGSDKVLFTRRILSTEQTLLMHQNSVSSGSP